MEIQKPELDQRNYRCIRLENGLEALICQDPECDKASAALDVHIGSMQDPADLPGLAHFLEHMLFMGTEKYPRENDYNEYLTQHGGHSNAYTASNNTNYYFDVSHDSLEGALDRFAQFFIAPLLSADGVDRETNAVDSEFKKNLNIDSRRIYQLLKHVADPQHPFNRFSSGNFVTLRDRPKEAGVNVLERMIQFYRKYYSAHLMKLVVLGRESLDTMEQWIRNKFSTVPTFSVDVPINEKHPYNEQGALKKLYLIKPVKDFRRLTLQFALPDQHVNWRFKPHSYFTHLLGHEGVGSILSLLKEKGWATALSAGCSGYAEGFDLLSIGIELTLNGLEAYEDIIVIVFQYLKTITESEPVEWIFRECQKLAQIAFRFKENSAPSTFTSHTASHMHDYPVNFVLSGSYVLEEYRPDLIKELRPYLRPQNSFISLVSMKEPQKLQAHLVDSSALKEPWYGTEYRCLNWPSSLLERLGALSSNPSLRLPDRNDFIPENLSVDGERITLTDDYLPPPPRLIHDDELIRTWYKKDDVFLVPRTNVYVLLKSPVAYQSPYQSALCKIYVELIKDKLMEYSYMAEVAGLYYSIDVVTEGLLVSVSGFTEKLALLLHRVLDSMRQLEIDAHRFAMCKEKIEKSYKNWSKDAPHSHAAYFTSYTMEEILWTPDDKLVELEHSIYDKQQVYQFMNEFYRALHVELLVHGSMRCEEVVESVMGSIKATLLAPSKVPQSITTFGAESLLKPVRSLSSFCRQNSRTHILPEGLQAAHLRDARDSTNPNSAIEYYIQVLRDVKAFRLRAYLTLLGNMIHEPAFDQLRTKEQLGYIVWGGLRCFIGSLGIRIIIQSERDTVYLENRIESFLSEYQNTLQELTEEQFQRHVQAAISILTQKDQNLAQESSRWWRKIQTGFYEFDNVATDVQHLKKVTKEKFIEFYSRYIVPGSKTVTKFSVHIRSTAFATHTPVLKSAADSSMSILRGLQNALKNFHGVHVSDEDLLKLIGSEMSALGSAGVAVSSSSSSIATNILASGAEANLRKLSDEPGDRVDFKALADKVVERMQIAVGAGRVGDVMAAPPSVVSGSPDDLTHPETSVSLKWTPEKEEFRSKFTSFTFSHTMQIINEGELMDFKARLPLSPAAVPINPDTLVVDGC